jgi:hypothetical protein
MLRKMLTLGALALVALAFGVGTAAAHPGHGNGATSPNGNAKGVDGMSDGRFGL